MLNQQKKEWPAQWEDSQADELNQPSQKHMATEKCQGERADEQDNSITTGKVADEPVAFFFSYVKGSY